METQHPEWILNLLKAHSGEPLLVQVAAEAVHRRDAELLERVEGMKLTMAERIAAKKTGLGIRNQTLDDVIKLIKGE